MKPYTNLFINKFEVRGTLRNGDLLNSANVICSLVFDHDEDYFAADGVSKEVKIFELNALLDDDSSDILYPSIEMSSQSKLSCVCRNNYINNYMASTDNEGLVQVRFLCTFSSFSYGSLYHIFQKKFSYHISFFLRYRGAEKK